jgi:hypothetical protein
MAYTRTNNNPQTGSSGKDTPWSTWNFWQYDDLATVPGDTNNDETDEDVFNGTAADLAASFIVVNLPAITTTTTLNPLTPSTYGQPATLTATVVPAPAGGTVQFYDNGVALGSPVTVSNGTATCSINTLAVGNHPITASYSGTTGYAASSTTGPSSQQVMFPPNSAPVNISGAVFLDNGALQLNFVGIPGYTYLIQAATDLSPPVAWTTLSTNVADINGLFNFIDLGAASYADRYYRTTTQ